MYFTMFMLGFLYAVFALFLWQAGTAMIFIAPIIGIIMAVQYFMSDRLILMSTGAKKVTAEQEPELPRDPLRRVRRCTGRRSPNACR